MAEDTTPQSEAGYETEQPAEVTEVETPEVAAAWQQPTTHAYISRIREPREYNLFLEEYYSSTDTKIYFDNIEQTEIGYIQYSVQEQLKPLYGYASNTWDDVAIGNRIVTGVLKVPIRNIEVLNYGEGLSNPAFGEMNEVVAYQGPVRDFDAVAYNEEQQKELEEQEWVDTSTPGGSAPDTSITKPPMSIGDLREEYYEEENKKQEDKKREPSIGDLLKGYYDNLSPEEQKSTKESIDKMIGDEYKDKSSQMPLGDLLQDYYNNLPESGKKKIKDKINQDIKNSDKNKNQGGTQPAPTPPTKPADPKPVEPTTPQQPEPQDNELVSVLQYTDGIHSELRYASANNFTGQRIYQPGTLPSLRYGTVKKLAAAQKYLKEKYNFSLKIWDAYRPHSAQVTLWEASGKNPAYVADPNRKRSGHNRGNTVDITLILPSGKEVPMPTDFDDFSERAGANYNGSDISNTAKYHRKILQEAMTKAGFTPYENEWWHFTDTTSYDYVYDE